MTTQTTASTNGNGHEHEAATTPATCHACTARIILEETASAMDVAEPQGGDLPVMVAMAQAHATLALRDTLAGLVLQVTDHGQDRP